MTGYRFFFPFRDMPTLIWVKKKEGIFCAGGLVAFRRSTRVRLPKI
jgi:hypothetical protein